MINGGRAADRFSAALVLVVIDVKNGVALAFEGRELGKQTCVVVGVVVGAIGTGVAGGIEGEGGVTDFDNTVAGASVGVNGVVFLCTVAIGVVRKHGRRGFVGGAAILG